MKKQLGLLTLGMALCLVAPVIGQANTENPESSNAKVTVTGNDGPIMITESPNLNFETIQSSATKIEKTGKTRGKLQVVSENDQAQWSVELSSSKFTNTNHTLGGTQLVLPFSSTKIDNEHFRFDDHGLVTVGEWSHNDKKPNVQTIMQQTATGRTGKFEQRFRQPTITVQPWAPSGSYVATLTWNLIPGT